MEQKTEKLQLEKLSLNKHTKHLLQCILSSNRAEINANLDRYQERGVVKFDNLFALPVGDRINGLAKRIGYKDVHIAIAASVSSALEMISVKDGLSGPMVAELASQIITESEEDQLALEDLLIFLKGLIAGKYGTIYNRLDIPTFFELFEVYRQQRHESMMTIREEQHIQHKALPITERWTEELDRREDDANHFAKLQEMTKKWGAPQGGEKNGQP